MKILIQLEGYLKSLYPEGVTVHARSFREALGLLATYPGFRKTDPKRHFVRVSGLGCYADLDADLRTPSFTVTPIMGGAGGGSGRQILIGALLIGLAFAMPGALASSKFALFLANMGASMVLGGLIASMNRAPKADPISGDKRSRFISGSKNTVDAGTPIPLIYGKMKVGGHYLSFDIDAEDYEPA